MCYIFISFTGQECEHRRIWLCSLNEPRRRQTSRKSRPQAHWICWYWSSADCRRSVWLCSLHSLSKWSLSEDDMILTGNFFLQSIVMKCLPVTRHLITRGVTTADTWHSESTLCKSSWLKWESGFPFHLSRVLALLKSHRLFSISFSRANLI